MIDLITNAIYYVVLFLGTLSFIRLLIVIPKAIRQAYEQGKMSRMNVIEKHEYLAVLTQRFIDRVTLLVRFLNFIRFTRVATFYANKLLDAQELKDQALKAAEYYRQLQETTKKWLEDVEATLTALKEREASTQIAPLITTSPTIH